MGEMADFALDCAWEDVEHHNRYKDSPLHIQYEEGLIDEAGAPIGNPSLCRDDKPDNLTKPSGSGLCPKCGADTQKKQGKFGGFYGCTNFPQCTGSRNL